MSRKDTIIIAVLINASILAFLFIMAMQTDDEVKPRDFTHVSHKEPALVLGDTNNMSPVDEVDHLLKDLSLPEEPTLITAKEEKSISQTTTKEETAYSEITVKKGDVLSKIAHSHGLTVEAIKKINDLHSEKLSVGQILRIPKDSKKREESPLVAEEKKPAITEYYVIRQGDNPWKIAKQHHVKFEDLLKINNLNEEKARNLKVGDKIRVH